MLEDVLGWIVVLIGAIVMRFTDFLWIDPLMSIAVALFIFIHAIRTLKESIDLFLEKAPSDVNIGELKKHLTQIDGVLDVHHIHIWSMDEAHRLATMHVVTEADPHRIKEEIREELREHGIGHATLELEVSGEHCHEQHCHRTETPISHGHHHHHHHH